MSVVVVGGGLDGLAVAHIDEDDPVMVTVRIDPTGEGRGLADVFLAEFVAMVRFVHGMGSRERVFAKGGVV